MESHTDPARAPTALTTDTMLELWLGHRRLTRRVIQAFPDDALFTYSSGGMRTFAGLTTEMLQMIEPVMRGALDDVWDGSGYGQPGPTTKDELLAAWDEADRILEESFPKIPVERFQQEVPAFGLWTAPLVVTLHYLMDNEVHHRGQGYVYLRELGLTPPPFYQRPPQLPEPDHFAQVGRCNTGTAAGDILACGPGRKGTVQPEMARIDAPWNYVLVVGRVFVDNDRDPPTVLALAEQIRIVPFDPGGPIRNREAPAPEPRLE